MSTSSSLKSFDILRTTVNKASVNQKIAIRMNAFSELYGLGFRVEIPCIKKENDEFQKVKEDLLRAFATTSIYGGYIVQ